MDDVRVVVFQGNRRLLSLLGEIFSHAQIRRGKLSQRSLVCHLEATIADGLEVCRTGADDGAVDRPCSLAAFNGEIGVITGVKEATGVSVRSNMKLRAAYF